MTEKRNTFDVMTDMAAELFEQHTGSTWRPLAGSKVNHKAMTAALIDSRDFISAKRRAETEIMMPQGTRIAFSGGTECNDHKRIWDALDKTLARYPDMVLLHGASPKGAERIAACWAESRKVTQIAVKPDWTKHAKAAPFRRNDQLLATRRASSSSPAPASSETSPTRPGSSAFQCGGSTRPHRPICPTDYAARRIARCAGRCRFHHDSARHR
jgi:hypothetical protein